MGWLTKEYACTRDTVYSLFRKREKNVRIILTTGREKIRDKTGK
jgi:hypothetical protein